MVLMVWICNASYTMVVINTICLCRHCPMRQKNTSVYPAGKVEKQDTTALSLSQFLRSICFHAKDISVQVIEGQSRDTDLNPGYQFRTHALNSASSQLRPPWEHDHHLTDISFVSCSTLSLKRHNLQRVSHINLTKNPRKETALGHSLSSWQENYYVIGIFLKTESIKDPHLAIMKTTGISLFFYYFFALE